MEEGGEKKWTKNELIATLFDGLATISLVIIVLKGLKGINISEISISVVLTWVIIPITFLLFGSLFRISKIGTLLGAMIEYMGVGGMPLVGIIILLLLFGFYMNSNETNQSKIFEVAKYFAGFVAGTFVQKKRTKTI